MMKINNHLALLSRVASCARSSYSSPRAGEALFLSTQHSHEKCLGTEIADSVAPAENSPTTSYATDHPAAVKRHHPCQGWRAHALRTSSTSIWWPASMASSSGSSSAAALPPLLHLGALQRPPLLTPPFGLRPLHTGSPAPAAAAAGDGGSGGSGDAGPKADPSAAGDAAGAPTAAPVQNPLQAALAAASGGETSSAQSGREGRPTKGRRLQKRTWMWYDEADEREERKHELTRARYRDVGTAHMTNITQSVKKMNRIIRLVRGLSYQDAVAQCKMVPHKAARYVLEALEAAYQDATQAVGLDGERLVVGIIYATRARVEKAMQRMGRGRSGRMFTRTSHMRVVLRESRHRPSVLQMRQVTPLMTVMSGGARPVAPWLANGSPAAVPRAARPRFAYRVEV